MLASIAEREQSRDLFTGRKDSKINPFRQTFGIKSLDIGQDVKVIWSFILFLERLRGASLRPVILLTN